MGVIELLSTISCHSFCKFSQTSLCTSGRNMEEWMICFPQSKCSFLRPNELSARLKSSLVYIVVCGFWMSNNLWILIFTNVNVFLSSCIVFIVCKCPGLSNQAPSVSVTDLSNLNSDRKSLKRGTVWVWVVEDTRQWITIQEMHQYLHAPLKIMQISILIINLQQPVFLSFFSFKCVLNS